MARFQTSGLEGLMLSFEEIAEIPDEIQQEMVEAGGAVVKQAHQAEIARLKLVDSGKLQNSIGVVSKNSRNYDFRRYALVYPQGDHHTHLRKSDKAQQTATNAEVGFVHEFGAPERGLKAKFWMKKANAKCGEDVESAESKAYFKWLDSINL